MKERRGKGLSRDKNLRINKNAGYKFAKKDKKDKSVNRRAGLHDKKRDIADGERRVLRCKPLALKHKRRMRKAAVVLAAVCVGAVSYVGMGFLFKPDGLFVEDLGNFTVKAQKRGDVSGNATGGDKVYYFPEDGSLPTDHTLIENVAYLNYVLSDVNTNWSSYMSSTVYTVMQQHVYTHKKSYKDENTGAYSFVSADMAVGASNTAEQFCVTEEEVIWRKAAGAISIESMDETEWDDNTFYGNTIGEFRSYRGLPANDFSVYILDEKTVINANDTTVKDNGDGTYSMTLDLRVQNYTGPDSAVHYYKQQMYVNGGLYAWPTFDYTRVTYNFTADWTLLSFTINDSYSAKMGVIAAACTSESTTVFNYEKQNAENGYREETFAARENGNYIHYSPFGNAKTLDAATCLANAFGNVLEEGAVFKINLGLNGRDLSGAVYVGLNEGDIADLRVSLGGLGVYLGDDNGKNMLYLAVGKDKFKLCTDGIFGAEGGDVSAQADDGDVLSGILDVNDLMKQLFAGEFDLQEKSATLKSTLSVFGLEIPIEFAFNVNGLNASLDYVYTSFSLNGSPVTARMTFGTEEDIPATPAANEKLLYKDILNEGLTLNLKLGIDNFVLNGAADINLANNGEFKGVDAYLGDFRVYYLADSGLVYLDIGGYKYKLDISELSGGAEVAALAETAGGSTAIGQLIDFIVGGISTDGNGLNFNGALAADNSFNVLGTVLKLALNVNLHGSLGVNAKIDIGGKVAGAEVTVSGGNSGIPAIGDINGYKDILNEGVTFGIALGLDGLRLDGIVDIVLSGGKLALVSANLGDLTVYYTAKDNTVYYSDTSGNKYKLPLGGFATGKAGGADLGGILGGFDIKAVLADIIKNLSASDGNISTEANLTVFEKALNVAANISFNGGLNVGLNTEVSGKKISATVKLAENTLSALNPAGYKDILNEGVTFNVSVKLDELRLNGLVYLGLKDGNVSAVRADLENENGDIAVYFDSSENMLYLKAGEGVKIKLPVSALGSGGASTVSASGLLNGIDVKGILNQLIGNLAFAENSLSSDVDIFIGDITANAGAVISLSGGIGADLTLDILNKNMELKADLAHGDGVPELTAEQKAVYADVLNRGFNVTGKVSVSVGGKDLFLNINKLAVSLATAEDGTFRFGFALDARLTVDDMYFDIYVSYLNGTATVVYGEVDVVTGENGESADNSNYFGATLDIANGDLVKLEEALVSVYNRISAVLDEIITNNPLKPTDKAGLEKQLTLDNLNKILEKLGIAVSLDKGGMNVMEMLGIPQSGGKIDIAGLLNGLKIYSPEGTIFGVSFGNMAIQLKNTDLNASVDLEIANSSARIYIENVALGVYSEPACPVAQGDLLTAEDFADMLDYIGAAAELLVEDEYSLSADVSVYEQDKVSYEVKILFEYIRGEKFPVHITVPETDADGNKTGLSVEFDDDMYWHLGVTLDNAAEDKDDLYIDIYILDANPAVTDGITTAGNTSTGNGLDVYVSVSKYGSAANSENYAPLKIYAPVNEILTVLSAGVALLDLQGIDISEESAVLQSVILQLGTLLDDALVKTYLPLTHAQFQSLGASLLPQIIGKDISTLFKDVLKTLTKGGEAKTAADGEGGDTTEPTVPPAVIPQPKHYINKISLGTSGAGDRMLSVILNSAAIYGEGYGNLTFEAYKNYTYGTAFADGEEDGKAIDTQAKSYITGASVKNIYFGGNQKVDIDLGVVRSVERKTVFDGYYDFSGVDTLLKALVNSATHTKANATDLDKEIYGDDLADYLLNRYYYLDGTIDLYIDLLKKNYPVKVAASAYIDKNNDVTINVKLDIPAMQEVMQVVTNGHTVTEITIKNGMIYIKRVQTSYWKVTAWVIYSEEQLATPETIYRVMPLSKFGSKANLMDNIVFLMNLGPVITDNLPKDGGNTEEETEKPKDLRDFGTQFNILKYFKTATDSNGANWELALNGGALDLGEEASKFISLNDVIVTLNADARYDEKTNSRAYTLTDVQINTALTLIGFVNITVSGGINYCNPQQVMGKQYKDVTVDYSADWEKLLGFSSGVLGTAASGLKEGVSYTPEVIAANAHWNKIIADLNTGKNYIEINSSSSTGVNFGEVVLNENGENVGALTIIYGSSGLLSVSPAIPEWAERTGYTLSVNYTGVKKGENGRLDFSGVTDFTNLSVNAVYTPNTYKINIVVDEDKGTVYSVDYVYGTRLNLSQYIGQKATAENGKVYTLTSFAYDGKNYYGDIDEFNVTETVTLTASWTEFDDNAEYTVTYVADGKTVVTRTYKYGDKISGDVTPEFGVTGYDFAGWDFGGVDICYGNREIEAVYTPHTYTVTVQAAGADGCDVNEIYAAGFADIALNYTYRGDALKLNALDNIRGFDFVRYYVLGEDGEKQTVAAFDMLTEDITVYAEFKDVRIKLNLSSDVAFTYNGQTATGNGGKFALDIYVLREDSALAAAESAEGWQFLGWWYFGEESGEYLQLTDALDIARPGDTVETEVLALWGRATMQSSGTYKDGLSRKYNMTCTANYEFKGFSGLTAQISLNSTTFYWYMNDGAALSWNSGNIDGNKATQHTFDQLSKPFYEGCMSKYETTFTAKFTNGADGNEITLSVTNSGKLSKA